MPYTYAMDYYMRCFKGPGPQNRIVSTVMLLGLAITRFLCIVPRIVAAVLLLMVRGLLLLLLERGRRSKARLERGLLSQ